MNTSCIKILQHLTCEINHRKWEVELLISDITVLDYIVPPEKCSLFLSLPTYLKHHGIYYTNTISNQITGIYWPHTKALYHNKSSNMCHQWHSRFCKILYEFGGLQPPRYTIQLGNKVLLWCMVGFRSISAKGTHDEPIELFLMPVNAPQLA